MTFIQKGAEPPSLAVWRELGNTTWDVPSDCKKDIRRACRVEQAELCAFCCSKLPVDTELQRIAHVEPRDVNPERTLDFSNMVLSCSSGRDRLASSYVRPASQSCDENQGSRLLPVHPLQPDCQAKFAYLANGKMVPPAEAAGAQEAIDILNLNCERLMRSRAAAIEAAEVMRGRLAPDQWERIYGNPLPGHLPEYWPAIAYQT